MIGGRRLYTAEGKTIEGRTLTLHIHDLKGDPRGKLTAGAILIADGVTLSTSKGGDFVTYGVHASQLRVALYSEFDREYLPLALKPDRTIACELLIEGTPYWVGILDGEQFDEPYSYERGYATNLVFSDFGQLGRMRVKELTKEATAISIESYIRKCCEAIHLNAEVQFNILTATRSWLRLEDVIGNPIHINKNYEALGRTQFLEDLEVFSRGGEEKIHKAFFDLTHFLPEDEEDEEEEPTAMEVLEQIVQALNLHIEQRDGAFRVYDTEALAQRQAQTPEPRGIDARLTPTEIYNRITMTISTDEVLTLGEELFDKVEENGTPLAVYDIGVNVYPTYETAASEAVKRAILYTDCTYKGKNNAFKYKALVDGTTEAGVAAVLNRARMGGFYAWGRTPTSDEERERAALDDVVARWDAFVQADMLLGASIPISTTGHDRRKQGELLTKSRLEGALASSSNGWRFWRETFTIPPSDMILGKDYYMALDLQLLLSNDYDYQQPDPTLSARRVRGEYNQKSNAYEKRRRIALHNGKKDGENVNLAPTYKRLYTYMDVYCGDYKLVNAAVYHDGEDGRKCNIHWHTPRPMWVKRSEETYTVGVGVTYMRTLLVQFGKDKFEYNRWTHPQTYTELGGRVNILWNPRSMEDDFQAVPEFDGKIVFPLPPKVASTIEIALSYGVIPIDEATKIHDSRKGINEEDLSKAGFPIVQIDYTDLASEAPQRGLTYYLAKDMKLSLVRRDGSRPEDEEIVLISRLNDSAFERLETEVCFSTDLELPITARALLFSSAGEAPAIRGDLYCGQFSGTLEELHLAYLYTHYSERRLSIEGTYSHTEGLVATFEGDRYLITAREYNLLREQEAVTLEQIKTIDFQANRIERRRK